MPPLGLSVRPAFALIDEARCIGCTLCIQACPVDAIVGAAQLMHTVIAKACIGCELCLAPCPVDCIDMRQSAPLDAAALGAAHSTARRRAQARERRLAIALEEKAAKAAAQRDAGAARRKRETIAKALERARLRLLQGVIPT